MEHPENPEEEKRQAGYGGHSLNVYNAMFRVFWVKMFLWLEGSTNHIIKKEFGMD